MRQAGSRPSLAWVSLLLLGLLCACGRSAAPGASGAVAPPASGEIDLAAAPDSLQTVPMRYRPIWRWWWPGIGLDHAEIDTELQAMHAAGFGGVEQALLRDPNHWWSAAFRSDTQYALEKATKLGLRFDVTLGPMWPMSSTAIDETSSMQEAIWSAVDVPGGLPYIGPVPQFDDNLLRRRSLVAVTAARVLIPGLAIPIAGGDFLPTTLDPASMIDLSAQVQDGVLNWQAPAGGQWKIISVWMRPTGQRPHGDLTTLAISVLEANLPINLPDIGRLAGPLVPDHFSHAAITATLAEYEETLFGGDMEAALRRNGGHVFEDSLELHHETLSLPLGGAMGVGRDGCIACNGVFWTPAFIEEFRKRRGYDLTPYLPAVLGAFDLPDEGGARIKADYDRTLTDLLVDNHFQPIRAWANARGLKSRAQGYNILGADKTYLSSKLELPDTESLDYGDTGDAVAPGSPEARVIFDDYRSIVSAAHLSGASEITLEAGANTLGEYDMSVGDYKIIADRAFAAGVTTMALHGFAYRDYQDLYQPWSWPGWSAFNILFGESWNQAHPAFPLWRGLAGYYGRISAALQNGKPRVDLTVLSTRLSAHEYGSADVSGALNGSDYSWDRIDDTSLAELAPPAGGRLLPGGPAYRALVIDNVAVISEGAAQAVLAIARAGVPVVLVGNPPARGQSYGDAAAEDAAIQAAFSTLLERPNVRQVADGAAAVAALAELQIVPDLQRAGLPIVAQQRRTAAGEVWFLYNDSMAPVSGLLTFVTTRAPTRIDPWTGIATSLGAWKQNAGSISVPLALGPGETTLLSFGGSADMRHAEPSEATILRRGSGLVLQASNGGPHSITLSNGHAQTVAVPALPAPLTIAGPWNLAVETAGPAGSESVELSLDELRDWQEIAELGLVSGSGVYAASIEVPAEWLAAGRRVVLDPGAYGGMVEVEVNGSKAALPSLPDGGRDVTALLKPGANDIRIRLATTVTNAIAGALRQGDVRYVEFLKNQPQPAGLLGPVRLIPRVEIGIDG